MGGLPQEAQISVETWDDWLSRSFEEYSVDNASVREIDEVINVPNFGPVVVTRHALERFVKRLSDGAPKHPWKALCSKLLCSALTKAQLPENVAIQKAKKYAQESEFWQHVGSKMHFIMIPGDSTKTLVTVFAVK